VAAPTFLMKKSMNICRIWSAVRPVSGILALKENNLTDENIGTGLLLQPIGQHSWPGMV
jgi:hypothetical protein